MVEMNTRGDNKLLEGSRIKVEWIYCRVRKRFKVKLCFRSFGYGHFQGVCKGPNRREEELCIQCGEKEHIKSVFRGAPKCFLCTDNKIGPTGYVPGTSKCRILREAMKTSKLRQK